MKLKIEKKKAFKNKLEISFYNDLLLAIESHNSWNQTPEETKRTIHQICTEYINKTNVNKARVDLDFHSPDPKSPTGCITRQSDVNGSPLFLIVEK